jgi:sterol desaturase/sphingolipid hydroxylase (fatty acid hydroxylase superfamily)
MVAGTLLMLVWQENRRPLRRATESKLRRQVRNFTIGALSAAAVVLAESPLIQPLAGHVESRHWGLLGTIHLPLWMEIAIALVLMDYTFYIWHVLMHRVPLLWRFHAVHHVDLDLDASTAVRFHFGELLISIPWRAAQVVLIGLTPLTFSVWQVLFAVSVLFHHSNVRIPIQWERVINRLIVTPRMHGIHHSIVAEETNANWSSGLTIWDRLHGTLRLNVPQEEVIVGVPAFRDPESVTLPKALALPLQPPRDFWRLPDGRIPAPHLGLVPPFYLLP